MRPLSTFVLRKMIVFAPFVTSISRFIDVELGSEHDPGWTLELEGLVP